jgi:hypothetical protein
MELHVERLALPFGNPALLAPVLLEAFRNQPTFEMCPIRSSSDD